LDERGFERRKAGGNPRKNKEEHGKNRFPAHRKTFGTCYCVKLTSAPGAGKHSVGVSFAVLADADG
jgi:hypothetical protein